MLKTAATTLLLLAFGARTAAACDTALWTCGASKKDPDVMCYPAAKQCTDVGRGCKTKIAKAFVVATWDVNNGKWLAYSFQYKTECARYQQALYQQHDNFPHITDCSLSTPLEHQWLMGYLNGKMPNGPVPQAVAAEPSSLELN